MHTIPDLGIPEVKPAIELYRGVQRQKVNPRYTHARLQMNLAWAVNNATETIGRTGTEWRFYFIERSGAPNSSLVPDVAFVSYERLPKRVDDEAERPTIAPDLAIEILSPDDRPAHVSEKIALYLAYGTACVAVVDPQSETLTVYRVRRASPQTFGPGSIVELGFNIRIDLDALFRKPA